MSTGPLLLSLDDFDGYFLTPAPTVEQCRNRLWAAVCEGLLWRPHNQSWIDRPYLNKLILPITRLRIRVWNVLVSMLRMNVHGHHLNSQTADDDIDDHPRRSGWYLWREHADVRTDGAQGLEGKPSYPNPGTVWNAAVEAHRNAFVPSVEPASRIAPLRRIDNHGCLHCPCRYDRLLVNVEGDGEVIEHRPNDGDVVAFEMAHPPVVADAADCLDFLLGFLEDFRRSGADLVQYGAELLEPMNPSRPQMLSAS